MENKVKSILKHASDNALANLIVGTFQEVEKNFYLGSWKSSELDAGHFVEAVRRFIEFKLFGKYTALNKSLSLFNDTTIQSYMNASGDDSYRIHIPRVLLGIYGIRNKRGVGHLSLISPNYQDASLILSSIKWVLAELLRLNSNVSIDDTIALVDQIVERNVEGLWEHGTITRILVEGLSIKEQILFLLFNSNVNNDEELRSIIEYKNQNYFKKILRDFHTDRFIEYLPSGECILTPKGAKVAEMVTLKKAKT
jgi:hypothetical protein